MCEHLHVAVCPTSETAWGLEDIYDIKCLQCGKILLTGAHPNEILKFIGINNCHIESGKKYLP